MSTIVKVSVDQTTDIVKVRVSEARDGTTPDLSAYAPLDSPSLITPSLGEAVMNGDIVPNENGTKNLGSGSIYLNGVYATTGYVGSMSVGYGPSGTAAGSIIIYSDTSGNQTRLGSLATDTRVVNFPDKAGTVAMTSDIIPISTGGTGATTTAGARLAIGGILQVVATELTADFSTAATIPYDATIPQSSEGVEYITAAITPKSASSILEIEAHLMVGGSAGGMIIAALFQDSDTNAIEAQAIGNAGGALLFPFVFRARVSAASTTARTYKLRIGSNGITVYVNRSSGIADIFGASVVSRLIVRELLFP